MRYLYENTYYFLALNDLCLNKNNCQGDHITAARIQIYYFNIIIITEPELLICSSTELCGCLMAELFQVQRPLLNPDIMLPVNNQNIQFKVYF